MKTFKFYLLISLCFLFFSCKKDLQPEFDNPTSEIQQKKAPVPEAFPNLVGEKIEVYYNGELITVEKKGRRIRLDGRYRF